MPHAPMPASDPYLEAFLRILGGDEGTLNSNLGYTVITGNSGPRWILPNNPRMNRSVLREWSPYDLASRLRWTAIRTVADCNILRFLPGTKQIVLAADCGLRLLKHLGWDAEVLPPVILVGTPTITRKLIIFLLDHEYRLTAVVKYPLTFAARASIKQEAQILSRLDGGFGAPNLLHYSEGQHAAAQEYLRGRMGSRQLRPHYLNLLFEFARTGETFLLEDSRRDLSKRLHKQDLYSRHEGTIQQLMKLLEKSTLLPAVLVHGDFAPWNLREISGGRCTVVDWESAKWRGMPMHDLCHFFYMQSRLFAINKPFFEYFLGVAPWRHYCDVLGLSSDCLRQLVGAYLLDRLATHWESSETEWAEFCLRQIREFLAHAGN